MVVLAAARVPLASSCLRSADLPRSPAARARTCRRRVLVCPAAASFSGAIDDGGPCGRPPRPLRAAGWLCREAALRRHAPAGRDHCLHACEGHAGLAADRHGRRHTTRRRQSLALGPRPWPRTSSSPISPIAAFGVWTHSSSHTRTSTTTERSRPSGVASPSGGSSQALWVRALRCPQS